MSSSSPSSTPVSLDAALRPIARTVVAGAVIFFGVQHFLYGAFVTRLVLPMSETPAASTAPVFAVGTALVLLGGGLGWRQSAALAAVGLAALLIISVLVTHLPKVVTDGWWGGSWTMLGKALVTLAGGFAVADAWKPDRAAKGSPWAERLACQLAPLAAWFLGAFMIVSGIQHFVWHEFVASLVPAWIPPGAVFWTYASAVLLLAGGLGMIWPRTRRLAAAWSAWMIFLWVPLLHVPRALASPAGTSNEWTAVGEALAFSAIACLIAVRRRATKS